MQSAVQIKYKNELWLNPLCPVCNSILALGMHCNTSETLTSLATSGVIKCRNRFQPAFYLDITKSNITI